VTVTDALGCMETATYIIISQVGLDENGIELSGYPNPTSGIFNLSLNGEFEYVVYTALGQEVLSGSAENKAQIDLSESKNGSYIVKVTTNEKSSMLYVVKQ
jgi:hypothetical protein